MRNTFGSDVVSYDMREEDIVLPTLPPKIKHYILFDCPFNTCAIDIQDCLDAGHSEDAILMAIRNQISIDTLNTYGSTHPEAR